MFNDISSLRSHLATRRSGKARDMIAPGPDTAALRAILALAPRTPDHGKLATWRLVTIADHQSATFAALLTRAWVARSEERRGGKEGLSTVRYRTSEYHAKKKKKNTQ